METAKKKKTVIALTTALAMLICFFGFYTQTTYAGKSNPGPIKVTKATYSESKQQLCVKYKITKKNTKSVRIELTNPATVQVYIIDGYNNVKKGTHEKKFKVKLTNHHDNSTSILYKINAKKYSSKNKQVKWIK